MKKGFDDVRGAFWVVSFNTVLLFMSLGLPCLLPPLNHCASVSS